MRTRTPSRSIALVASLSLSLPAVAQNNVWVIGSGGDFPDLASGIAAASDGDVLWHQTASSSATIDGKSLTIIGGAMLETLTVRNLAADQAVVLRRPTLGPSISGGVGLAVQNCAGAVWVVDCDIEGEFASPGVTASGCERLVFNRCEITGDFFGTGPDSFFSAPGMITSDSNVELFDCTVTGADGQSSGIPSIPSNDGEPAIRMTGGELFVGGSTLIGGDGGPGTTFSGFCLDPRPGGDAIFLESAPSASVRILDSTLLPGDGGAPATGCPDPGGLNGQFVDGPGFGAASVVFAPGVSRGFIATSPAFEGQVATFEIVAPPGEVGFFVLAAFPEITPVLTLGIDLLVAQPWKIFSASGAVPPSGVLQKTLVSGTLNPVLEALRLFGQGFTVEPTTLQVFLCAPSDHIVMDASFGT